MIHKDLFTKIAKQIVRPHTMLQNPRLMHPMREWVIGLIIASVLFSVSAFWSVGEYIKYRDVTIAEQSIDEEVVVYRAGMVTSALEEFEQRAITHQSLLTQSISILPAVEDVLPEPTATSSDSLINQESSNESELLSEWSDNEVLSSESE